MKNLLSVQPKYLDLSELQFLSPKLNTLDGYIKSSDEN